MHAWLDLKFIFSRGVRSGSLGSALSLTHTSPPNAPSPASLLSLRTSTFSWRGPPLPLVSPRAPSQDPLTAREGGSLLSNRFVARSPPFFFLPSYAPRPFSPTHLDRHLSTRTVPELVGTKAAWQLDSIPLRLFRIRPVQISLQVTVVGWRPPRPRPPPRPLPLPPPAPSAAPLRRACCAAPAAAARGTAAASTRSNTGALPTRLPAARPWQKRVQVAPRGRRKSQQRLLFPHLQGTAAPAGPPPPPPRPTPSPPPSPPRLPALATPGARSPRSSRRATPRPLRARRRRPGPSSTKAAPR